MSTFHRAIVLSFGLAVLAGCHTTSDKPAAEASSVAPAAATPAAGHWWNDRVFYEVFVRSFADSTTGPLANDGIGDFEGLIEKLDYLNDGDPATHDRPRHHRHLADAHQPSRRATTATTSPTTTASTRTTARVRTSSGSRGSATSAASR